MSAGALQQALHPATSKSHDVGRLAQVAVKIEEHYGMPMDIDRGMAWQKNPPRQVLVGVIEGIGAELFNCVVPVVTVRIPLPKILGQIVHVRITEDEVKTYNRIEAIDGAYVANNHHCTSPKISPALLQSLDFPRRFKICGCPPMPM